MTDGERRGFLKAPKDVQADSRIVSLAAVFWMSRNAPPKGGALRDMQKAAARETNSRNK